MSLRHLLLKLDSMPMLKVVIPFAGGIVGASYFALPLWFIAGAFLLSGGLALLFRSQICVVAMLLATGFAAAQLHEKERTTPYNLFSTYRVAIDGIPADKGRYSSAQAVIKAWRNPSNGQWYASGDGVMLYVDSLVRLNPDEHLILRGSIRPFRGGEESWRKLMERRGFIGTVWLPERNLIESQPPQSTSLHIHATERIGRLGLEGDADAVCRAMVAGDWSRITPQVRTDYSRSGLVHILSVSGLHTGIVFVFINMMLWWMPLLRRGHLWRNLIAIAAIWTYVAATGFPPSAVRAAVMCSMLQFALASGSEYVALNSLSAALFGMLLWNPAWLWDISVQLSFIAVAAIVVWGVPLCRLLRTRYKAVNMLVNTLVISFVATLSTAPLISHTFGIVSLAGLLVNPLAIPLGSVAVIGGVIWIVLPFAWLVPLFKFVLSTSIDWLNYLAHFASQLSWGAADVTLSGWITAGIYLLFVAITAVIWSVEDKKLSL